MLGSVASASLEAKAAIAGVVIGLERMTGWASQIGMDLHKFNVTTGLSAQQLQKWQYAAKMFDVTGQEVTSTVTQLQTAMTDMDLKGVAPEGLGLLAETIGFDTERAKKDAFYVLGKLQEFAKTQPTAVARNVLSTFGISDNMFQALKVMDVTKDKISKRDLISNQEVEKLTKINRGWKEIWATLQAMGTHAVADWGMPGVEAIMNAINLLRDGWEVIDGWLKRFEVLRYIVVAIAAAFALWLSPITAMTAAVTGLIALFSEIQKFREGKDNAISAVGDQFKSGFDFLTGASKPEWAQSATGSGGSSNSGGMNVGMFTPQVPAGTGGGSNTTNQTLNANINIDGSASPKETAAEVQRAVKNAFRQLPANAGGY